MHCYADVLIHFEVAKARFHAQSNILICKIKQTWTLSVKEFVIFPRISSLFMIKFGKLGSTYESYMESAVLMLLLIILGSAWQQHNI